MSSVDEEVKRILAEDVKITFEVTSLEIRNCKDTAEVENLADRYMEIVRRVLLSKIKEQHPRFN